MSGSERRKQPRFRIDLPVTVSAGGRWLRATILDISAGGLQIHADDEIAPGKKMSLRLLRGEQVCTARASTRWHRGRDVGVQFDEMSEPLRRFLDDLTTLRPTFHRSLIEQLSEAEISFD